MSCCCSPLQLALMLVLTFAPCAGGVFFPSSGANTPLAHVVVSTCCNMRWWCFSFQPLAQILYLHSCNLHCVVVVACGGGIYIYIYIFTAFTAQLSGTPARSPHAFDLRVINTIILCRLLLLFKMQYIYILSHGCDVSIGN